MNVLRRVALIVAMTVLLATAVEYALLTASASQSVATGGTIISEN